MNLSTQVRTREASTHAQRTRAIPRAGTRRNAHAGAWGRASLHGSGRSGGWLQQIQAAS